MKKYLLGMIFLLYVNNAFGFETCAVESSTTLTPSPMSCCGGQWKSPADCSNTDGAAAQCTVQTGYTCALDV